MSARYCQLFVLLVSVLDAAQGAESPRAAAPVVPVAIAPDDRSVSALRSIIQRYVTDRAALDRLRDVPFSPARAERARRFLDEQQKALGSVSFPTLDPDSRVDYVLFQSRLRFEQQELKREAVRFQEVQPWAPFASPILSIVEARRGGHPLDMPQIAQQIVRLGDQAAETKKGLEETLKEKPASGATNATSRPLSKTLANRVARSVDQLRDALRDWNGFYSGYDPEFGWWMKQPFERCDKQLLEYASALRKEVVGIKEGEDAPLVGDPIGREALMSALADEMIPYTPEELIRIGEAEFAWCDKEWRRAAQDLGFGDDWRKALDHVSSLHVKPGAQPRLISELADEAVRFLEERDLVTIPPLCKEVWRMEMMSPERQKVNPYFTGGEVISISFPTDGMTHEDKVMSLRGNNIHFCRATVQHELIPGHHLQGFMAARYRTHRSLFYTPFLVEGWALYWEMLLWDLGFPKTPEDRVGMLFWRTHRCARILFSLKFHMGQMSAQEAVDFLVDRVGHERRNATAEVRRSIIGGYGPLYQAAYMLGGLQLRALRNELVESGKMTHRQFHDAVLRENTIPIEMIRASLTGQPPVADFAPRWRFYPGL
ncbi:MAG: DUF885 family protein [Verrucomicrobia bacterium]|nr:DUF885 family protein [Verrucomicrobiota bacterium]MBI3870565.1 DUF885 family protein [Verrucomicrobiota bacterium]